MLAAVNDAVMPAPSVAANPTVFLRAAGMFMLGLACGAAGWFGHARFAVLPVPDAMGTVPDVDPCEFTKCLDNPGPGARAFHWTCYDNPFIDHAAIDDTCRESGLVPGHPVYEREILGRRVRDP